VIERADTLLALRRPREALAELERALANDPANALLHGMRARAFLDLEDWEAALEAASRAIACDPHEEWGFRLRAVALMRLGRWDEAVDAAGDACVLGLEISATHSTLARALSGAGDHDRAIAAARYAVELDPDDAETHAVLGDVLSETRPTLPEALHAYEVALSIDPEHTHALNNLAVARLRIHEHDRGAARVFAKALQIDPADPVARRNLMHSGEAGDVYSCRRMSMLLVLPCFVIVWLDPLVALAWLGLPAFLEATRLVLLARLPSPVRRMVLDDCHARRWSPSRWDWGWIIGRPPG